MHRIQFASQSGSDHGFATTEVVSDIIKMVSLKQIQYNTPFNFLHIGEKILTLTTSVGEYFSPSGKLTLIFKSFLTQNRSQSTLTTQSNGFCVLVPHRNKTVVVMKIVHNLVKQAYW